MSLSLSVCLEASSRGHWSESFYILAHSWAHNPCGDDPWDLGLGNASHIGGRNTQSLERGLSGSSGGPGGGGSFHRRWAMTNHGSGTTPVPRKNAVLLNVLDLSQSGHGLFRWPHGV